MITTDERVDAYIAKSGEFAQPILKHLRGVVHAGAPDVVETIKWSMPSFTHGGKIVAHMAAFKAHCAFGFWQGSAVVGESDPANAMGQFGRIETLKDLPPKAELVKLVKKAVALIDAGPSASPLKKKAPPKPPLETPDDLAAALQGEPKAKKAFDAFPPGHRREYIEWIVEAKKAETRERRIAQAVEWIGEGKARNWKYQDC